MNKVSPINNTVKSDIVKCQFIKEMHKMCSNKIFYKAMNPKQKDKLFTKIYDVLYKNIDSNKKMLYDFFALKEIEDKITLLNNKINNNKTNNDKIIIKLHNFFKNDDSIEDCFNGFIKEKELLLPITTIEKKINSQKKDIENREQEFLIEIKNKEQILLKTIEGNKKVLKKMESDKKSSLEVIKKEEIGNIEKEKITKENQSRQEIVKKRINSLILLLKIDCDNILIENIQMIIGSWLKKDNKDLYYKKTDLKPLCFKLYDKTDDDQVGRLSNFKEYFIDTMLPGLVSCFNDVSVLEDIYKIDSIDGKKDKIISLLNEIKNRDNESDKNNNKYNESDKNNNKYNGFVSSLGEDNFLDDIDKDGNKLIEIYQKEIKRLQEKLDKEIEDLKKAYITSHNSLVRTYDDEQSTLRETYDKEMLVLKNLLATEEHRLEKAKKDFSGELSLDDIQKEIDKCEEYLSVYKKQMLSIDEYYRNHENEHSIDTMKTLYELYRYIKKIKGEENEIDKIDNLYKDLCDKTNELSSLDVGEIEYGMKRVIGAIIESISKINDHVSFSRSEAKKNNVYVEVNNKCAEAVAATVCMPLYLPLTMLGDTNLSRFITNKPNEDSEQKYKNELRTFLNNKTAVSDLIKVLLVINNESLQQNNVLDRRSSGASTLGCNQL